MRLRRLLLLLSILLLVPVALSQKARQSDYCGLFNPSNSEGDLVTTVAYMTYSSVSRVDGGDSFFFWPTCNNEDYFAIASFSKNLPKTKKKFFSELPNEKSYILKLTVTGRLRTSFLPRFGHLSWSRSQFEVEMIESISNATGEHKVELPDLNARAPLAELAKHLHRLNMELVPALLGGSLSKEDKTSLDPTFTLTDQNGKVFSKDQVHLINIQGLFAESVDGFDRRAVRQPEVDVVGPNYIATGLFWVENSAGNKKTLEYQNLFRRDGDSFVLMKTSIRDIPKNTLDQR